MDLKGENAVENIREFNTFYTKIYIPLKGIKPVVFYKLVFNTIEFISNNMKFSKVSSLGTILAYGVQLYLT